MRYVHYTAQMKVMDCDNHELSQQGSSVVCRVIEVVSKYGQSRLLLSGDFKSGKGKERNVVPLGVACRESGVSCFFTVKQHTAIKHASHQHRREFGCLAPLPGASDTSSAGHVGGELIVTDAKKLTRHGE